MDVGHPQEPASLDSHVANRRRQACLVSDTSCMRKCAIYIHQVSSSLIRKTQHVSLLFFHACRLPDKLAAKSQRIPVVLPTSTPQTLAGLELQKPRIFASSLAPLVQNWQASWKSVSAPVCIDATALAATGQKDFSNPDVDKIFLVRSSSNTANSAAVSLRNPWSACWGSQRLLMQPLNKEVSL